ncbi:beta strand repeat-containing protein, partial [Novosphingobium mangrovi (ex Huang et al. 2023)]|nr:hypothetical protein [Novosphingobium mangrovi (ex Huang et al. 2023)]
DGIGGTIAISAAQGSITSNGLNLYAGGYGGSGDTLGGAGLGGSISLDASQGATIDVQSTIADTTGYGGYGGLAGIGGDGTGGAIDLAVSGGATYASTGFTSFYADGYGYDGFLAGGTGTGGVISLTDTGGTFDFSSLFLSADGTGAYSDTLFGDGIGGSVLISLRGADQNWDYLYASAIATAGDSYGSPSAAVGGIATGDSVNGVSLDINGVALNLTGGLELNADAYGNLNGDATSLATAGRANLSISGGGALVTDASVKVTASAHVSLGDVTGDPDVTSSLQGGTTSLDISGGSLTAGQLDVLAEAEGFGALVLAGQARGGTASATVSNGGILNVGSPTGTGTLTVSAAAIGNFETFFTPTSPTVDTGFAADAQGGTATLQLVSGQVSTAGATLVTASGTGGPSGNGSDGGNGTGGTATLAMSGGTFTFGSDLDVLATGIGGTAILGGTSGAGTGGLAAFDATGGTATIASGNLTISAGALAQDIDITQTGSGGDARGGTARLGTAGT